jgi:hypothetical protein
MTRQGEFDDWLVYAAFLPALLVLTGVAVTAAIAWHNHALWQVGSMSASYAGDDDYVQGLARLGIAQLPHQELSEKAAPVVASNR